MWCVRSVSLDDLHPDDVRGLLIRHCQAPAGIAEAEATASFDSDFERDVYRKVVARGYRVRSWTFHRLRGSAYYRSPEESLSSLWERLESLGIYPADDESGVIEPPGD